MTMDRAALPGGPVMAAGDVVKSFGEGTLRTVVLRNVTLALEPGQLTLLMGPSGSGKTTLISILAGMMRASSGQVSLCGHSIESATDAEIARIRRRHVGFVFQTPNLFSALSALDNVAEVLRMKGHSGASAQVRAEEALRMVGLEQQRKLLPAQLSGGQKQRVSIARALADDPQLLIGDEMTSALDSHNAMEIMHLVRSQTGGRRSALLVTHDPRLTKFADRVVMMEDGRVASDTFVGALAS